MQSKQHKATNNSKILVQAVYTMLRLKPTLINMDNCALQSCRIIAYYISFFNYIRLNYDML